jgi:segregation and condensation protein A
LSVAEAVEELIDELPRVGRIGFRELTSGLVERLEVVVRFLAVLEMFKQGYVDIHQAATFGDIAIVWLGVDAAVAEEGSVLAGVDAYDG